MKKTYNTPTLELESVAIKDIMCSSIPFHSQVVTPENGGYDDNIFFP